jgi:hypothetical protein
VELLVALVVNSFGVRVVVDDLLLAFLLLAFWKLHLLLFITLVGNLLLAFLLAGRCAIVAWLLLLLLMEHLQELLHLPALLNTVASGVVHQAPWPTLIAIRGLAQLLVTAWATTPTSRCSDSSDSGRTYQLLFVVVGLLLPILVLATALSSGI